MTGFIKRLGWYLVGLSIGLLFFVFILKKKSGDKSLEFCYLPNCRVLKELRTKPMELSPELQSQIEKDKDSVIFYSYFGEGNVLFSKSDTKSKPCSFYIIENNKGQLIKATNCPEKVSVSVFTP
ncbi:DUF4258 domain-containing protein [Croceivirga sp. JEA036]|uniref:DUF4258 domain-containing protein n=1 Tax=Croceivirga sp. JEA036 TaxID=2721162 RepID=UPI001438F130|nr:DUF4258 domain-containing protein [Croceivirga sp. JEA036]NJB35564.1 DUF4258 domain-containing protein [Croceivirga sp. JEA036]